MTLQLHLSQKKKKKTLLVSHCFLTLFLTLALLAILDTFAWLSIFCHFWFGPESLPLLIPPIVGILTTELPFLWTLQCIICKVAWCLRSTKLFWLYRHGDASDAVVGPPPEDACVYLLLVNVGQRGHCGAEVNESGPHVHRAGLSAQILLQHPPPHTHTHPPTHASYSAQAEKISSPWSGLILETWKLTRSHTTGIKRQRRPTGLCPRSQTRPCSLTPKPEITQISLRSYLHFFNLLSSLNP